MKGDIAQRSIRDSISLMVDVKAPRTISSVMGSTVIGPPSPALQDDAEALVHPRAESGRDEHGGVLLVHDGRPHERHVGREPLARVHGAADEAASHEVHGLLAGARA